MPDKEREEPPTSKVIFSDLSEHDRKLLDQIAHLVTVGMNGLENVTAKRIMEYVLADRQATRKYIVRRALEAVPTYTHHNCTDNRCFTCIETMVLDKYTFKLRTALNKLADAEEK